MKKTNWARWSLLSGFVFVVLWIVSTAMAGQNKYLPPAEEISAHFIDNYSQISYAGYVGVVSMFFLLWFSGSLRSVLNRGLQEQGLLADIAAGGGIAASLLGMIAASSTRALAERAETTGGFGLDAATSLVDLSGQLSGLALPVAFAVLITASGLALLRTGMLPTWFGWVSVILGIALVSPLIYAVLPLGFLWTVVVSLWLFARSDENQAAR
jgi:hypothetical protein